MAESSTAGSKMKKIKPQNRTWIFDGKDVEEFIEFYELAADIDEASDHDRARQAGCFVTPEIFKIIVTLDGYKPPDWAKLKASMLSYWGRLDKALYTERDLVALVSTWQGKGGVASVADYQEFQKTWGPLQSYLVSKKHIDSVEEIRKDFYQAFSPGLQERIRDQLIKDKSLVVTLDNRRRLPEFKILKAAVDEVMEGQVALTFEDSRSTAPVASPFQASNDIMKRMGEERRPAQTASTPVPSTSIDELTKMFQSLEQYLKKEPASTATDRPAMICFYCHRERHGTLHCRELQADKEQGLVEQRGTNFFLPNGALIPFDRSRPIRHVVATFSASNPSRPSTPTRQSVNAASSEYKAGCGSLEPMWYPPAVSSQSFAGTYEADPAGRKRHEEPRPFKAPLAPASQARRPIRKPSREEVEPSKSGPADEPELFDRIMNGPDPDAPAAKGAPSRPATPPKASGSQPKVRFERDVLREQPEVVTELLRTIGDLEVPRVTVSQLCAASPAVAEGVKKWVSRRRVEVGSEELKVNSGTLAEGIDPDGEFDPNLYSCPLGYLNCSVGEGEAISSPLVDSGSQLNLISDTLAVKLNLTPRVNFSSAVYGINNQACELIGVAEDVPIRIGRSIVGSCHFWITRADGPFILGRPFLMDFKATLMFSPTAGERIILPDPSGRNIEVTLCPVDKGRWEREFPAYGRKGVLAHCGRILEGSSEDSAFL
ncbi:hypothetical protein PTTG_08451 [Puccinia triticina 1-1 BBBD Race 1]|uniref:Uncharacterized protein n=1 Tax=Puccinia triticina (isolate 1-1 / race 1 (BBBD)) TaxID=630390 RepID=A0A180FZV3_PUCT1|nr:hypothetical protein PTTG_08451 [Puccinia triticina 1-1 BBBD Race 1]